MGFRATMMNLPGRVQTRWLLILYALLLATSFVVRSNSPVDEPLTASQRAVLVHARRGVSADSGNVRLVYRDLQSTEDPDRPVVLLRHGSPGVGVDFSTIIPLLSDRFRVIVPDLPGFGSSTRDVPDYSIRAHAAYVADLLDASGIRHAHVVGFSMGGGVALNLIDQAPERVRSLTMLSAIGVQEMVLGEYPERVSQRARRLDSNDDCGRHGRLLHAGALGNASRNCHEADRSRSYPRRVARGLRRSRGFTTGSCAHEGSRLVPVESGVCVRGGELIRRTATS